MHYRTLKNLELALTIVIYTLIATAVITVSYKWGQYQASVDRYEGLTEYTQACVQAPSNTRVWDTTKDDAIYTAIISAEEHDRAQRNMPKVTSKSKKEANPDHEMCTRSNVIMSAMQKIKEHEGFRAKAYRDADGWSIGYGRHFKHRPKMAIDELTASKWLYNDLCRFARGLDKKLPWWRDLSPTRQEVILNMAYNVGIGGLLRFKKTLRAMRNNDFRTAACEILFDGDPQDTSRYYSQVKTRAVELASAVYFDGWTDVHVETMRTIVA